MSPPVQAGGCFCGQLRFELVAPVDAACYCHCESCRRAAGAPFVVWCTVERGHFRVTRGELAEHASSPRVVRGFCAQCGTSITYTHEARPNEIDVTVVTLDDPDPVVPRRHLWVRDKLPWVVIDDGLPQFQEFSVPIDSA